MVVKKSTLFSIKGIQKINHVVTVFGTFISKTDFPQLKDKWPTKIYHKAILNKKFICKIQ